MAMKYLLLLTAAYVGGRLRHPHEGVIHVDEADAEQVIADKVAEDVTADFETVDTSDDALERIAADAATEGNAPSAATENPHQADIMPDVPDTATAENVPDEVAEKLPETKPSRRKAAASKE